MGDVLRIGMNLLWLRPGEVGGTETYARRILRALASTPEETKVEFHLFGSAPAIEAVEQTTMSEVCSTVAHVASPSVIAPARRVFVERTWLPGAVRNAELDVLHHLGGTVPMSSELASVVTIHDLQPLELSANFSKTKVRYLQRAIPQAAERTQVVTTPSDWVKSRVTERFGTDPGSVVTVSAFAESIDLSEPPQPSPRVERVLARGPALVYPAMTLGHKNHSMLFTAFENAAARDADLQLVCVGSPGRDDAEIRALGSQTSPRINMLGHVTKADLDALYRSAEALVFPSLYEGFGLPVLEAQHYGLPVICSDRTALPEVAGAGAILLDASTPDDWADVMVERLGTRARSELVSAGFENAKRYSMAATSEQQWRAYRLATA